LFETRGKLADDIRGLLGRLRHLSGGRYACLLEPRGVLFEEADDAEGPPWTLRRFLEQHAAEVFAIPGSLHSEAPMEDAFAEWDKDAFYLAFVNGRVAVVVACADPGVLEARGGRLIKALVDRLIRYNPAWRADERGRGLFFSRPRLDTVVVGRLSD
jgi:hypothetical protein